MKKWHKTTLVVTGAIVFSTIAIQASDVLRNIDGNLMGSAIESQGLCGAGAIEVILNTGSLCVDVYEASPADSCPVQSPETQLQTQENMNEYACAASSEQSMLPWRHVSLTQAQQLCGRVGKRLPTNDEWYALVSSMGDQSECIVDAGGPRGTGDTQCVTQSGIYDMVGNVWEWIDGEVQEGVYNQRHLPESGYISSVDSDGIVVETSVGASDEYGADYVTTNLQGIRGMLRGGFYGSGEDAGLYAQNISLALNAKAPGVGFRCVRSI